MPTLRVARTSRSTRQPCSANYAAGSTLPRPSSPTDSTLPRRTSPRSSAERPTFGCPRSAATSRLSADAWRSEPRSPARASRSALGLPPRCVAGAPERSPPAQPRDLATPRPKRQGIRLQQTTPDPRPSEISRTGGTRQRAPGASRTADDQAVQLQNILQREIDRLTPAELFLGHTS